MHLSRFPGQYEDKETGLYYNYFRDYQPSLGRYVQADPIGLRDGVNIFSYSRHSPLMLFDYTGLSRGSGWNEPLIPDQPYGFDFEPCCAAHDDCYGNCGSTRSACDNNFCSCMAAKCSNPIVEIAVTCLGVARTYCDAVVKYGKKPFDDAQDDCPRTCSQDNA